MTGQIKPGLSPFRVMVRLILVITILVFFPFESMAQQELDIIAADPHSLEYGDPSTRPEAGTHEYRIGPHDLLEVDVFRVEEFTRVVRVNSRGSISLPLIGSVVAHGKTSEELEQIIAKSLQLSFLQEPHVSVFVKEYASQKVTLEGEVKKPGLYALTGRTTVLQAIAMAEGLTDLADIGGVQLFRPNRDGRMLSYVLDVKAIRNGETRDPLVFGNDILVVHRATFRSFTKALTDTLRGFVTFGRPF
ncbi:MAG: polysaccharide export protein [Gammaproteobacteria bacterium]|nr:polysaccharide export protein [Gammaproteobacteria bacterium]